MSDGANRHTRLVITTVLAAAALLAAPGSAQERHLEFSDGFRAYKEGDWKEAVIKMWQAQQDRPEDGQRIRTHGRWPEPYLPAYYLGAALYELGCYREALEQLDLSVLGEQEVRGAKTESKRLAELKEECESRITSELYEESEDCPTWREWGRDNEDDDDDENG